jgi:hypothetical protein
MFSLWLFCFIIRSKNKVKGKAAQNDYPQTLKAKFLHLI